MIATKHDLDALLADESTHAAALAHLQCLMDERYQYDAAGAWGVVEPNGLTRLGVTAAEAVGMGAVDQAVGEPAYSGPTLDAAKAAACVAVDARAEALRSAVLTPGSGQMAAYQEKERQARALLADATPTEDEYPDIYNEIGITAESAGEVAMAVLAAAEKWRAFGRLVERARLAGKKAVGEAHDAASVRAAQDGIVWPQC